VSGTAEIRPAVGWLARRAHDGADRVLRTLSPLPAGVPPRRLRARVGAPGVEEYVSGGAAAAAQLDRALAPRRMADFSAVLDFGCGPGRVLQHVAALDPDGRMVGVDVDAEAIAWASEHVEDLDFRASRALPRLPVSDEEFDLVYSISVFSHLDEPAQDAWLAELARVLAPGGAALLSTHGPTAFDAFRRQAVRTAWCAPGAFDRGPLGDREVVSVPYRRNPWSRGDLPGVGEGYGLTFHGPGYLRERWGAFLEIDRIEPRAVSGWQDLVVARRR
jgi:SAM-dependent methyltransferase